MVKYLNIRPFHSNLTLIPPGIAIECQSERSQIQNRAKAMQRLRAKLFQMEINKQESETRSSRKKQVCSFFVELFED